MKKSKILFSFLLMLVTAFALIACGGQETVTTTESSSTTEEEAISFGVALNASSKEMVQGDTFILVATLEGIDEYDSVGWAADGNLLTISPNGLNAVITAGTDTGEETITVTVTKDGVSETASCVVTVDTISLDMSVESDNITLIQGESTEITVAVEPDKTETVISWSEDGSLLTIDSDDDTATITAGSATGTTTLNITAEIFGESFVKPITVTVEEITPYVEISQSTADVRAGEEIVLDLDFLSAFDMDKSWSLSSTDNQVLSAVVNSEDQLVISGLTEGQATVTLTMTTDGLTYEDTVLVNVRPLGYVGISENVYDQFDLQLNFTESTFFSSIDEEIWQDYNILLGAANNSGENEVRGEFVFAINHEFAKDGERDVIQVMANGMSAIAIKIPESIDDLGAIQFSMKMADVEESLDRDWRMSVYIASVVDGKTMLYARENSENNALKLGDLTLPFEDLLRDGYQTYTFFVNEIPENAGNYILIYFGNTNAFNGEEGNRTYIESFNFLSKELSSVAVTTEPTTTEYVEGQLFDPAGMVVSAIYNLGNEVPIAVEDLSFDYDFSTPGEKIVTISYGDFTTTLEVNVIERVISELEITTLPDKVIYIEDEVFDTTGMVVTAIYNDGSTEVVSSYTVDTTPLVAFQENVEVGYSGLTINVPVTVNATALSSISVSSEPTDLEYVVGQDMNFDGLQVTATFDDMSTAVIPFDELIISGFDSSAVEVGQVITVEYGDQSATFTVDIIAKTLTSVDVISYPRVVYMVGEAANWMGLEVVEVYNDETTEPVNFEDLTITGFDTSAVGQATITITYQSFTTSFAINVTDETGYVQVDTEDMNFDTTNLVNNETMYTDLFSGDNPANISDYDVLLGRILNDAQRNLQYRDIMVFQGEGADRIISVATNGMSAMAVRIPDGLSAEDITAFTFSISGEHLDVDESALFRPGFRYSSIADGVEYFHGTSRGDYYLDESYRAAIGYEELTRTGYQDYTIPMNLPELPDGVSYGNYIIIYMGNNGTFRDANSLYFNSFKFWTRDVVQDISLISEPTKVVYEVGEEFDPAGLVIAPLYGVELLEFDPMIDYSDLEFTYDFSTTGEKVVTISYGDLSVDVTVNVIEKQITGLEITTLPDTVVYREGQMFDSTGMVVSVVYGDDTTEEIMDYTYNDVALVADQEFVVLSYEGFDVNVPITVSLAVLDNIAITSEPTDTEYVVGQAMNFDGLIVTATYDDMSTEVIAFEDLTITGFDSSAVEAGQDITVVYGGQSATFTVDIIAREVSGIDIQTFPTVVYEVGETEDWVDLEVVKVFNDGTSEAVLFEDLNISGFDSTTAGEIVITVTLDTFTTTFNVVIIDAPTDDGYTQVFSPDLNFDESILVNKDTMYTDIFTGTDPASQSDFDVLLGRTLNDGQRALQYSDAIYFEGEGAERIIVVQTNGMSAMAVRIPDGLTAEEITAFSIMISGEHITFDDSALFRPRFRFSSIFGGVEYFHTTDRGDYYLGESGRLEIPDGDLSRTGYHDYTVKLDLPELPDGVTFGNYLLIYMGNSGDFRGDTSLYFNGFKFWTKDAVSDISITSEPTQMTYEVGEMFNTEGLVVSAIYAIDLYDASTNVDISDLDITYDFSTAGQADVTITYGSISKTITVTVVEPAA